MNGNRVVFDTCAVIKLLDPKYELPSLGINIDEAQLYTSVVVRMELLAKPELRSQEERTILAFLNAIVVAPLDSSVEKTAIEIRRSTKIKLPDCIVAATAITLNAILLTNDDHLLGLSWPSFKSLKIL